MKHIRNYFIGVNSPIRTENNIYRERVYLNSAATGLPLRNVVNKINKLLPYYTFYETDSYAGLKLTDEYEHVRNIALDYVKANKLENTAIFVKSSTYAINLLAEIMLQNNPNSVVLSAAINGLPSYLPFKNRFQTDFIGFTATGNVNLNELEQKLISYAGKVKLVTITAASNITGITPAIYEAAKLAHKYGAKIFVDTTQYLQHKPFNIKPNSADNHIDFIAFSAHKYYSPYNSGVLIGPASYLEMFCPPNTGSYITNFVSTEKIIYKDSPFKYETGYANVLAVIAMGEALNSLNFIGLNKIMQYEKKLYDYTINKLQEIDRVFIYGLASNEVNIPIISFNVKGSNNRKVASDLGYKYGIIIGSGNLSSDIYIQYLQGLSPQEAYKLYLKAEYQSVCRVSLAFYNTKSEIDRFVEALKIIIKHSGK